jgi:hypothetical protein
MRICVAVIPIHLVFYILTKNNSPRFDIFRHFLFLLITMNRYLAFIHSIRVECYERYYTSDAASLARFQRGS